MTERSNIDPERRVQWVYSSTSNDELASRYDEWAQDYDDDLINTFVWLSPRLGAEALAARVSASGRILDAGAGTGLVGVELQRLGYRDICALDLSEGMLREARAKGCYAEFHQMALGERLDFESDTFDAVISIGVFTLGHAPANAFEELCRVAKPGGCVVVSLRPDTRAEQGYEEWQNKLTTRGAWSLESVSEPFYALPKGEPDVQHQIWVYRVN